MSVNAPLPADWTIAFASNQMGDSRIILDSGAALGATIANFARGDSVDFNGVAYVSTDHLHYQANNARTGGTVELENSTGAIVDALFKIAGAGYVTADFSLVAGGTGSLVKFV